MNGSSNSSRTCVLALVALAAGFQFGNHQARADQASDALKWTPHRASATRVERHQDQAGPLVFASEPSPTTAVTRAPATVTLPDRVPVVNAAPAVRRTYPATIASRPRRPAPPPIPAPSSGLSTRVYDPAKPDSVFGVRVVRTPPAIVGQPTRQATRPYQPQVNNAPLGGGLAPRYSQTRSAATQRPERLAMNADGLPSVMRQPSAGDPASSGAPQLAPPDGRLLPPPDATPNEPLEVESIGPGLEIQESGEGLEFLGDGYEYDGGHVQHENDGLLMGEYPTQLHVESFYDDPYAGDPEEAELAFLRHDGRIIRWLRQFGRPYYGWRWYRDLSASAGVTSFTNATDLGINGNFGTNEYLNWAMPLWNAFGLGWQIGARGVQSNFQTSTLEVGGVTLTKNARDQQFVTTGLFTRAFEGHGLQGGIAYDYLQDSWFENTDLAQLRYELSYVWGYHEFGVWGASNIDDQIGIFGNRTPNPGVAKTLDLYTAFYRVQFGDANEAKMWVGGTNEEDGIIGGLVRAPLHRSAAVEGTFTYVIPNRDHTVTIGGSGEQSRFSPAAWNLSLNLVWYPAARSRRGLASPYRPLFDVADNGSMIRSIEGLLGP